MMSATDELDASVYQGDAPLWEDDKHVKNCNGCNNKFSFTRRKHHCRACGRIFCDTCSPHKDILPQAFDTTGTQRTCDTCHLGLERLRISDDVEASASRPDPAQVHAELIEKIKNILKEPEETWVKKHSKKSVRLDVQKVKDSALVVVRTSMTVKAPFRKTLGMYDNKELWGKWQPDMLKCQTLEKLSNEAEFLYVLYKVPVLDNRDACIYSSWIPGTVNESSKATARTLISVSVSHPLCGRIKNTVRARINFGSTTFEEVDANTTSIVSHFHTDPRGIIPPRIVNSTLGKTVDQMLEMINFMESADFEAPAQLPCDVPVPTGPQTAIV